jgi:hypothetical protein
VYLSTNGLVGALSKKSALYCFIGLCRGVSTSMEILGVVLVKERE